MKPNNVTRLLDQRKIPYTAFGLPARKMSALEVAAYLGVKPELVYKTIVLTRVEQGKPILAIIPGPGEVDLKAIAKILEIKKITIPTEREAERLTGLQAGGISPLALLNRGFRVIIDQSALHQEYIFISGGERTINIRVPVSDLANLTKARFAPIQQSPG